jgi:hypothetical protein
MHLHTFPPVVTRPSSLTLTWEYQIMHDLHTAWVNNPNLNDGALGDDAQLREERTAGILLDANDGQ